MDKIVIDLEMCHVNKCARCTEYRYSQEIIQIGAVRLDSDHQLVERFSTFVRPEYGKLDGFINRLTGIYERQLKTAPLLSEALQLFCDWIGKEPFEIYAWSGSDYAQIMHEVISKNILNPDILHLLKSEYWVDYQEYFCKRFHLRSTPSLKLAFDLTDMTREGREHDGLDDAFDTARLISMLHHDPGFKLNPLYDQAKQEPEELTFSLGSLFPNLLQGTA